MVRAVFRYEAQGYHQAIFTLTERNSRLVLLRKVDLSIAEMVSKAMSNLLHPFLDREHTITGDNGKEFTEHKRIAQQLCIDFLFAHPSAAW